MLSYSIHMDTYGEREPVFRGKRLAKLLVQRGLSLGQLEYKSDVSKSMLSHLTSDNRPGVSAVIVAKLARALDVSIEYLLDLTDDPRPVTVVEGAVAEEKGVYHVLTEQQQTIIDYVAGLSDDEQELVMRLLETLRKHNIPRVIE